jgi:nucleoside-diphosphate-sugar epimerase
LSSSAEPGHIGTYLVPHLVEAGHEVINISRGQRQPYHPHSAWKQVQSITIDREAADEAGTFGDQIRDLARMLSSITNVTRWIAPVIW